LPVFWALALVWLLPWSGFLAQALGQIPGWREWFGAKLDARRRANLLFGLWAGVVLVFFSFSTSQECYNLPALPGLALLIVGWLGRESASERRIRSARAAECLQLSLDGLGADAAAAASGKLSQRMRAYASRRQIHPD